MATTKLVYCSLPRKRLLALHDERVDCHVAIQSHLETAELRPRELLEHTFENRGFKQSKPDLFCDFLEYHHIPLVPLTCIDRFPRCFFHTVFVPLRRQINSLFESLFRLNRHSSVISILVPAASVQCCSERAHARRASLIPVWSLVRIRPIIWSNTTSFRFLQNSSESS